MMKVTRNVILDLLPLYLANEVSADTRALIEAYLATDAELKQMAQAPEKLGLPSHIPLSINKETEMEAYQDAQRWLLLRTLIWAGALTFVISLVVLAGIGAALLVMR